MTYTVAYAGRTSHWLLLGLVILWPACAYQTLGATEGSTYRASHCLFCPRVMQLAALRQLHSVQLRGGNDDGHADGSNNVPESPNHYPHIPTDELSEDERETLYMYRDVERQYYEGNLTPEARRQFDDWMAQQTAALQQGIRLIKSHAHRSVLLRTKIKTLTMCACKRVHA